MHGSGNSAWVRESRGEGRDSGDPQPRREERDYHGGVDPLWAALAEMWWIVPVATGAGVLAVLGLRYQRVVDARRLEYDAAKLELRDARTHAWAVRGHVRLARAEVARVQAERGAGRATPDEVARARRILQEAQRAARAATADVRVRRLRVSAARAGIHAATDPAHRPLALLMAAHDEVTARWLEYETDPARLIMFPTMSDGRVPTTAAYLAARAEAQQLRPASAQTRMTPLEFLAYRRAVERLSRAFEAAEQAAWRDARATGMMPPEPRPEPATTWSATAEQLLERSSAALAWASENAAALRDRLADAAARADRSTSAPPPERPDVRASAPAPPHPAGPPAATPSSSPQPSPASAESSPQPSPASAESLPAPPRPVPTNPDHAARTVWPVPSRGSHRPAS